MNSSKEQEESEKLQAVGHAFSIGMSYVQTAINSLESDPEQSRAAADKFAQLLQRAQSDLRLATVFPDEALLMQMKIVNSDRLLLLRVLRELVNAKAPENQQKIAKAALMGIAKTYALLVANHRGGLGAVELVRREVALQKPVINDAIESHALQLRLSKFDFGNGHYRLAIDLNDAHAEFSKPKPDSELSHTFRDIYDKPRVRVPNMKVVFRLTEVVKKLLKKEEIAVGTCDLPLSAFRSKAEFSAKMSIKCKRTKTMKTFELTATMRAPLETPILADMKVPIHLCPAAINQRAAAPAPVATSAPAPVTAPTSAPSHAPAAKPKAAQAPPRRKRPVPEVFVLPDEEITAFISVSPLEVILNQLKLYCDTVAYNKDSPDPKIIEYQRRMQQKFDKIVQGTENGTLSQEMYMKMMQRQISLNKKKIAALPKGELHRNILEGMTGMMCDELREMTEE